jgi:hypothetical protein
MTAQQLQAALAEQYGIRLASLEDAEYFGSELEADPGVDPAELYSYLLEEGEIDGPADYNFDPSRWISTGSEAWHENRLNDVADEYEDGLGRTLLDSEWTRLDAAYSAADGDLAAVEFAPLDTDDRDQRARYFDEAFAASTPALADDSPAPSVDDDPAGYIDAVMAGHTPEPTPENTQRRRVRRRRKQ